MSRRIDGRADSSTTPSQQVSPLEPCSPAVLHFRSHPLRHRTAVQSKFTRRSRLREQRSIQSQPCRQRRYLSTALRGTMRHTTWSFARAGEDGWVVAHGPAGEPPSRTSLLPAGDDTRAGTVSPAECMATRHKAARGMPETLETASNLALACLPTPAPRSAARSLSSSTPKPTARAAGAARRTSG